MTTFKNAGAASVPLTAATLAGESRVVLIGRLRRMADEVEQLQNEIAAVEAFVTDPGPIATEQTGQVMRPGAGWTPNPTPQPWLEARSA